MTKAGWLTQRDGATGMGRARHQRPTRLLPAPASGHRYRAGRIPNCGASPEPGWRNITPPDGELPGAIGGADARADITEAKAQLLAKAKRGGGKTTGTARVFTGNRPSVTLAYKKLDPSRSAASLRSMSIASSLRRRSGTSTPLTNGASSSARNWPRDCNPSSKARFQPRVRTVPPQDW